MEGGDVMLVDKHFYVGLSDRTNKEGARQFNEIVSKFGYTSSTIPVTEGLHLKDFVIYLENNNMLENTISGVTEILDKNGAVIYTGQPWHPQLKQIALVLNSHKGNGKSWLMRRRSEKELDSLFEKYNLKKEKMLIDNEGIFTVSLAEMR